MSNAAKRMFYVMLGGGLVGECPPYTMPPPDAANINMVKVRVDLPPESVNVNLCEELI